jgi:hypothetical protein
MCNLLKYNKKKQCVGVCSFSISYMTYSYYIHYLCIFILNRSSLFIKTDLYQAEILFLGKKCGYL